MGEGPTSCYIPPVLARPHVSKVHVKSVPDTLPLLPSPFWLPLRHRASAGAAL